MVLLILAALWIVVLGPGLYRRWAERQPAGSIASFHRELRLLRRAGPNLVAPAFRLETAMSRTDLAPNQSGFPAVASTPGRPSLVLLGAVDEKERGMAQRREGYGASGGPRIRRPSGAHRAGGSTLRSRVGMGGPRSRDRAQARRRRVAGGLVAMMVVTGLAGVSRSLRLAWVVTGLAAFLLLAFGALYVYSRRLVAEQRRRATRSRRSTGSVTAGERRTGTGRRHPDDTWVYPSHRSAYDELPPDDDDEDEDELAGLRRLGGRVAGSRRPRRGVLRVARGTGFGDEAEDAWDTGDVGYGERQYRFEDADEDVYGFEGAHQDPFEGPFGEYDEPRWAAGGR